MADIVATPNSTLYQNALQRLKDNLDGTWAPVTAGNLPTIESPLTLPALSSIVLDSAAGQTFGAKKTIYLIVTVALTWVTSGQATWRPYVSRAAFAAIGAATSQLTVNQLLLGGAAVNLGAAAQTSLPIGMYRLSAATVAELANPDLLAGIELIFPSALTGGACTAFLESAT